MVITTKNFNDENLNKIKFYYQKYTQNLVKLNCVEDSEPFFTPNYLIYCNYNF